MHRIIPVIGLSAVLVATVPLAANDQQEVSAATGTEAPKPAEDRKICKRTEADMGSRVSTKVCRTASEWKAIYAAERKPTYDKDSDK